MKLLGVEITDQEWNDLMVAQANGKELKVIDNKVVAVDHKPSKEELKQVRITAIQTRLNELSQDFIQMQLGAIFEDEEDRKEEFKSLHNELRQLLNKELREYN